MSDEERYGGREWLKHASPKEIIERIEEEDEKATLEKIKREIRCIEQTLSFRKILHDKNPTLYKEMYRKRPEWKKMIERDNEELKRRLKELKGWFKEMKSR